MHYVCIIKRNTMSLKKQFLKSKPVCKVTFTLPTDAAPSADQVFVAGEFNNWSPAETPMTKLKNGTFKTVVNLETGRDYAFRYVIDGKTWENDWEADAYQPNGLTFEDNSIVSLS